jgi:NitT/TauT family transport system substrate-binding protein
MFVNILLAKQGLKPDDAAYIGVGATAGAVAIMKRGEIDAISNLDPVVSMLEADGTIVAVVDTRTAKGMQDVYNGAYAAGSIYAPADFAKKYPNTAQAVVNAIVRRCDSSRRRRRTRSSPPFRPSTTPTRRSTRRRS